jgi:LysR family transcriptional regulator, glycine cleavage system transcriptional activator
MALRLPPLSGLRLFEAAARCGSFKLAAHELNLTPGAVSHGIDSLEHWLDVELFERKAHGIILTTAGRQFLPYVSEALSTIATGTLRLPSRRFEEHLAISSFSLFAYKVLLPRLHKFQALYPNMTVTVDVSREIVQRPRFLAEFVLRSARAPRFCSCRIDRLRSRAFARRSLGLVPRHLDPNSNLRRRLGNLVQS